MFWKYECLNLNAVVTLCCYNEIRWPLDCNFNGNSVWTPHGMASHRVDDGTSSDIHFWSLHVESLSMFLLKSQSLPFQPTDSMGHADNSQSFIGWCRILGDQGVDKLDLSTRRTRSSNKLCFRSNIRSINFRSRIPLDFHLIAVRTQINHQWFAQLENSAWLKSCLQCRSEWQSEW